VNPRSSPIYREARKKSINGRSRMSEAELGRSPGTERRPLRCVLAPRTALGLLDWLRLCQPPGQVGRLPLIDAPTVGVANL